MFVEGRGGEPSSRSSHYSKQYSINARAAQAVFFLCLNLDLTSTKINDAQLLLKDGNLAELALKLKTGITYFTLSNATATGLPSGDSKWLYGHGIILVRMPGQDAKIILHSLMTAEIAINTCNNGIWTGWDSGITKSDLGKMAKTGRSNDTIWIGDSEEQVYLLVNKGAKTLEAIFANGERITLKAT